MLFIEGPGSHVVISRYVLGFDLPESQYIYETSLDSLFSVDEGDGGIPDGSGGVGMLFFFNQ